MRNGAIPVAEVQDSDFGEFLQAAAGPVQMLDEPELTDRELLLALLAEVRGLRQEMAELKSCAPSLRNL